MRLFEKLICCNNSDTDFKKHSQNNLIGLSSLSADNRSDFYIPASFNYVFVEIKHVSFPATTET